MLFEPRANVIGDADIDRTVMTARENVDVMLPVFIGRLELAKATLTGVMDPGFRQVDILNKLLQSSEQIKNTLASL
nr:hypothetical protein [Bradyrhizobium diazoefficiens]